MKNVVLVLFFKLIVTLILFADVIKSPTGYNYRLKITCSFLVSKVLIIFILLILF